LSAIEFLLGRFDHGLPDDLQVKRSTSPGPAGYPGCMPRLLETAEPLVPERPTIPRLRAASATCKACDLWKTGTQTVFGEGARKARVMLVGEQPGDREDKEGRPFVGPAGRLLDRALAEAGIERSDAYVTNAVKHFKWEARGKRRIHQAPSAREVAACRPWLEAELAVVRPEVLVLLGATAARSLLGSKVRVTKDRGRPLDSPLAAVVGVTVHPSSILRAPDEETRHRELAALTEDLRALAG
jgi:DNA polymerase